MIKKALCGTHLVAQLEAEDEFVRIQRRQPDQQAAKPATDVHKADQAVRRGRCSAAIVRRAIAGGSGIRSAGVSAG